jgi:putative two-component system response regulator
LIERVSSHIHSARILVVDDEGMNLRLLRRILEREGYTSIRTTAEGKEVEQLVEEFDPHLLILDLHMPPPDGFAILRMLAPKWTGPAQLPVLVLTGDGSPTAKRTALSLGARDFLAKPFDATEALLRIRNLLETKFLHTELEAQNTVLESRVQDRTSELEQSQIEILERLARAAEIRDDETGRHTQRVGELACSLAEALGLGVKSVELIRRSAPLHDVGKIGIPDAILLKPGRLSPEEMAVMRSHTVIGARILSGGRSEVMIMAERIALGHHERWDGTGYPHGVAGEAIPIEARIVAVADCVDALTHNRPYRQAWPIADVLAEVQRSSGSHFDPAIAEVMLRSECHKRIVASPPHPWPAVREVDEARRTFSIR